MTSSAVPIPIVGGGGGSISIGLTFGLVRPYGPTTLNKPKSREVSTNDGIITLNIFNAAVPTSIETK